MKTGSLSHPYNALILKAVGVILILGTLVDYIMLAVPPNFLNSEWLVSLISEWVGRGSVPLLGLAILFLGVWLDRSSAESNSLKGLPTIAFILSMVLGLLFLVLAPLYFNNSRLTSAAQTRQINEAAAQSERRINNQLAQLAQQRDRVSAIISDEAQLARLRQQLESLDLPEDQQAQIRQFQDTLDRVQSDPKALDQEVAKARTQGQAELQEIQARQRTALNQLQSKMRRDRLHITLSSLVFAIGYLVVAWTGLGGSSRRKANARAR